ncbi:MAG: DUF6475 domain-containing protein [Saprospiraceae bacterium]
MVTRELFKSTIAMLRNLYGFEMNQEMFETYYTALNGLMDDNSFKNATADIMKTFKPTSQTKFPSIPCFLESVNLSGTPRAKEAIAELKYAVGRFGRYDSVNFGDSKLHQAIGYYGGWISICKWTDEDWRYQEKGFIDTYNSMQSDHRHNYLPGLHERNNSGRYKIAPPKQVYLTMKKEPVEELEYFPDVGSAKIEHIEPVKQLVDKMDINKDELPF